MMDNEEKSIIKELIEIQKKLPNVVLPTMGMLEDNLKIKINNKDYINEENTKLSEEN